MSAESSQGAQADPISFQASDFDAYDEKKWRSKKFTLERRKTKDKLVTLAKGVQATLQDALSGLELMFTDEGPSIQNNNSVECQLAYFLRNADDRRAIRKLVNKTDLALGAAALDIALQHEHACIFMKVDAKGFTAGVDLAGRATVDRENVAEKLRQGWAKERFVEILRALPPKSGVGFGSSCRAILDASLDDVDEWAKRFSSSTEPFLAYVFLDRADPVVSNGDFSLHAIELIRPFVTLYRFIAWSRDNEHKQVKEAVKKTTEERQKKEIAFQAGDRVTILTGLFAGRGGYLSEIDTKGRAKVMVGPVSVTVEVKDLKAT